MSYKGKFTPTNPGKYEGDFTNITFRSLWERGAMVWCDTNPNVVKWNSEDTIIPYICRTDNKPHRYFMDLKITYSNGKTVLVEIKPAAQVKKPDLTGKKMTRRLLESVATYAKNSSKWEAAEKYCQARGWSFQIWDEHTLEKIGIKTLKTAKRSHR